MRESNERLPRSALIARQVRDGKGCLHSSWNVEYRLLVMPCSILITTLTFGMSFGNRIWRSRLSKCQLRNAGNSAAPCQAAFCRPPAAACNLRTVPQFRVVAASAVMRKNSLTSLESMMPRAHHRYAAFLPTASASGTQVS
jgi:hypothetical protein